MTAGRVLPVGLSGPKVRPCITSPLGIRGSCRTGLRGPLASDPSILHVPDEVHLLHEGRIDLAGPPRTFVESADPVVRQFIDGRADGPLPVW